MNYRFDKFAKNPLIELGMDVSLCWNGHIINSSIVSSMTSII